MKGDITIFDPVIGREESFMFARSKTTGFMVSGVPSLALNKANNEPQSGDFSSHDTFAQYDWGGQSTQYQQIGPAGVDNWEPSTLSYNIFPTSSFQSSDRMDVMREEQEIRLGPDSEEIHTGMDFLNVKKYCDTFIGIERNSRGIKKSEDGVSWTYEELDDTDYLFDYNPDSESSVFKEGASNIDRSGKVKRRVIKDIPSATVTDVVSASITVNSSNIKFDPEHGILVITIPDMTVWGVGQQVRINDGGRIIAYYIAAIADNRLYLTDSGPQILGSASSFLGHTVTSKEVLIKGDDDDFVDLNLSAVYSSKVGEVNFTHALDVRTAVDDGRGLSIVTLADNNGIAKGNGTLCSGNAEGIYGLVVSNPTVVGDEQTISCSVTSGSYRMDDGRWGEIDAQTVKGPLVSSLYVYAKDNSILTSPQLSEAQKHVMLATIYVDIESKLIYAPDGSNVNVAKNSPTIISNIRNQVQFNSSSVGLSSIESVMTLDLLESEVETWRNENRFILSDNKPFKSIMWYPDSKARMVIEYPLSVNDVIEKKEVYELPPLDTPTQIDSMNDSVLIGGLNHLYIEKDILSHPLYEDTFDYDPGNKESQYYKIKFNNCENTKEYVSEIVNDGTNFYIGTTSYNSVGTKSYYFNTYIYSSKSGLQKLPPLKGRGVSGMYFQKYSNKLYISSDGYLYEISNPSSPQRKIKEVKEYPSNIEYIGGFHNGLIISEGENIHKILSNNEYIDILTGSDQSIAVHPYKNGFLSFSDDSVYKSSYDLNNLSNKGRLTSSWYYGTTPMLTKNFNYVKVVTRNFKEGDEVRVLYRIDKDSDFKYLPIKEKDGDYSDNGNPSVERSSSLSDQSDYNTHFFSFPANTKGKGVQYILELVRDGVTNDPGIDAVAIQYSPVEQKELMYTMSLDLSNVLESDTLSTSYQSPEKLLMFLEDIWRTRRIVIADLPNGDKQYLIPYAQVRDTTNGFSYVTNDYESDLGKCKKKSYTVTITFKSFYPLTNEKTII